MGIHKIFNRKHFFIHLKQIFPIYFYYICEERHRVSNTRYQAGKHLESVKCLLSLPLRIQVGVTCFASPKSWTRVIQVARAGVGLLKHTDIHLLFLQLLGPSGTNVSAPATANSFLQCTALTHTQNHILSKE